MRVRWLHESTCHRHPQFERHVEPCDVVAPLPGTPGEIVNGVFATEQCPENSARTRFGNRATFKSAPGYEPTTNRRKHNGIEEWRVLRIKGQLMKTDLEGSSARSPS